MATTMDEEVNGAHQYARSTPDCSLQPAQERLDEYPTDTHKITTPPALCSHNHIETKNLCTKHHLHNSNSSSCLAITGNEPECNYSDCNDPEEINDDEDEEEDGDCAYDEYEIYDTDCLFRYVCAAGVENIINFCTNS